MKTKQESTPKLEQLPSVGGRRLDCSNNEFERRCLVCLLHEQEKIAPDNSVIAVLCDAVRCVREYNDTMKLMFSNPNDITDTERLNWLLKGAVLLRGMSYLGNYTRAEIDATMRSEK
jgi:hypothetical protein